MESGWLAMCVCIAVSDFDRWVSSGKLQERANHRLCFELTAYGERRFARVEVTTDAHRGCV